MSYYVYIDKKPDGTPFYVGIGNSARIKNVQRNHWHRAIRLKYPNWTRTVIENAPRKLCEDFEELLIAEIGRRDLGLGPLVNLTDGGEGSPSTVVSEQTRKKQSVSGKGRKKKEEWKAMMSVRMTGRHVSPETGRKISASKTGKPTAPSPTKFTSEMIRARWEDADYAAKMSMMSRQNWENETRRKEASDRMRLRMSDPQLLADMTEKVTNTWKNPELRKEASARTKGKIWVCKDGKSMRILPTEIDKYLLDGWRKGRK